MTRIHAVTIALLTSAAMVAVGFEAQAVSFSKKEKSYLAAGKTVKQPLENSGKGGFFGGSGYTIIDAPPEVVWSAIEDWASYSNVYPNTVEVKEVARKDNRSLVYMEQGHPLVSASYFVEVERDPAKHMLSFRLVEDRPHDIEDARGYWKLFPQKDGRTLVAYVVAVKVPMGLVNLLGDKLSGRLGKALLHVPGSLKKWLEGPEGNRYRTMAARN